MNATGAFAPIVLATFLVLAGAPPSPAEEACAVLERQLEAVNAPRPPAAAPHEQAVARLRAELDRSVGAARSAGCLGGSLYVQKPPQAACRPLNQRIARLKARLAGLAAERARAFQPHADMRDRLSVLAALAENGCGAEYARFGRPPEAPAPSETAFGYGADLGSVAFDGIVKIEETGGFRTLCVRRCDGYYFPISFATDASRFADDERSCRALCPGADAALYVHRNPGGDVGAMTSLSGEPYTALPAAFRYRQALDPACSCGRPAGPAPEAGEASPAPASPTAAAPPGPAPKTGFAKPVRVVGPADYVAQ